MAFEMSIPNKRPDNMSFEDFKLYRKTYKQYLKNYKKGTVFFESLTPQTRETSTGELLKVMVARTYRKNES